MDAVNSVSARDPGSRHQEFHPMKLIIRLFQHQRTDHA